MKRSAWKGLLILCVALLLILSLVQRNEIRRIQNLEEIMEIQERLIEIQDKLIEDSVNR